MTMKILVVGGGGREHAIAGALSGSTVCSVMSRRNPGIDRISARVLIARETDVRCVADFAAAQGIDYAIIGPEAPLEAGIADALETKGIPCVGPTRLAARLETDKAFCREMMMRHGIAGCPQYRVFHKVAEAADFVASSDEDLAIKPIGLTGGKGVRIMGEHLDRKGAVEYIRGLSGGVVLEERLVGEEFTLQAFVDGSHLVPMPLVQDHKRAYEGDLGPNTGGMGSYSMPDHTLPFVTDGERARALAIMKDVVAVMDSEGHPYRGILYGQFMNTRDGPAVIEFNARFGDPEAMNVIPLLKTDLSEVIAMIAEGSLRAPAVRWRHAATVCKYLVPEGYPEKPQVGKQIFLGDRGQARSSGSRIRSVRQRPSRSRVWQA
jgi:phosphoribosylamine--glycine ligase